MLVTILVVVLVLALLGGLMPFGGGPVAPGAAPGWYHGYGYGAGAGGVLGLIVVVLLVLALLGRI